MPSSTREVLRTRGSSWARALVANGQSPAGGALTAVGRLLFWHWLQPALYWAVFACFYDQIDGAQRGFGWAVAVREALEALEAESGKRSWREAQLEQQISMLKADVTKLVGALHTA